MIENYKELDEKNFLEIKEPGKKVEIDEMLITCSHQGAILNLTDGKTHRKLYLRQGINDICEWPMSFYPEKCLKIFIENGKATLFYRYKVTDNARKC